MARAPNALVAAHVLEHNLRRLTDRQPNLHVISASQVWDEKKLGQALPLTTVWGVGYRLG